MAHVIAVCISEEKGTAKHQVPEICLKKGFGITGDAHAGNWHRQISLLGVESVKKLKMSFPELSAGAFAENILTEGMVLYDLPIGTRLQIGSAQIQITQIGKECHTNCAIRKQTGDCVMPREGIFAIVLKDGVIHAGDSITIMPG